MIAKSRILAALWAALVVACILAPGASAVVVHSGSGQFLGVTPRPGVAAAAISGSVAAARSASSTPTMSAAGAWWENLNYQGGPVLHSSAPYVVFWSPGTETITSAWQSLIERYFADVASDSGKATNVYAVGRQFTDATGFADYQQTFDPATQVIQDTNAYPSRDTTNCGASPYTTCLTDGQLQSEISSLITADGLPSDGPTGATQMPGAAPIYFVVLPSDVDVCFSDGSGTCASNYFCAYHSAYVNGTNNVLYATIPSVALNSAQDAKGCQWDGNSLVQQPNGSLGDVALKYISHEDNETITDPLGTGWWSDYTGYENGDNCNDSDTDSNAFLPTLGGDASAGALYNQLVAGDQYYLQSEWSNGGSQCLMQPSSATITPRFSVPSGPRTAGSALTFDPASSTSTYGFSSETWNFGDGTPTSFRAGHTLTTATHTYAAPGDYTVTLTLVDRRGNLTTGSEEISVGDPTTAAFTASPTELQEGTGPVSFDASGSSDSNGAITSYAWDFGDGSTAQGEAATHTYATHGTYLVRLTITDGTYVDTATSTITVTDEPPVSAFAVGNTAPEAGQSVAFDGSSSSDSDGSIVSYAWNFGDGHRGSAATPTHAFSTPGSYPATLTVTDTDGERSSSTHTLTVLPGPVAHLNLSSTQAQEASSIGFDATGSAAGGAPGAAVAAYAWSFGDGATSTSAAPSHSYASAGTYTVELTVTDSAGVSTSTTRTVTVLDEPPTAAFGANPAVPIPGQAVTFDGRGSGDPDGAIVSYAWTFGDGTGAAGATPSHAYTSPGTYNVSLTIVDRAGQSATVSKAVTVYAQPKATFGYSPVLPVEGSATTFTATSPSADPATMISSYAWDFGDGTSATGPTAVHTYSHEGSYRVGLTVTDGLGLSSTVSEVVTVIDAAPVAELSILTRHRVAGHAVLFSGARSHDPDDPIVSYLWHFGDRSGAVAKKPDHSFARAGSYRVSLTVRDSFGQTTTVTTTVKVSRTAAVSKDRRSHRRQLRRH